MKSMRSNYVINLEIINVFQLKVEVPQSAAHSYAFHLYSRKKLIQRTAYSNMSSHVFNLETAGSYRVKVYFRQAGGNRVSQFSVPIRFRGLAAEPSQTARDPIIVYGLTKNSIAAAKIFQKRNKVIGLVDPSGLSTGSNVFGIPIISHLPANGTIVGLEEFAADCPSLHPFSMAIGSYDILSRELNRIGAIDIYRIAHDLYLNGLTKAAHFLEMWIMTKYNSRIPYKSRIGKETSLGYGGVGVIVHSHAIIGENCVISPNVTIGVRGSGASPIIGNNVFIGPGAKCLGGRIGNNVVIGANAVVLNEVPDDTVVAGVPARVISSEIDNYSSYTHRRRKLANRK